MSATLTQQPTKVVLAGLAADSYGVDDERAPIVLMHGHSSSRKHWAPVIAELQQLDADRRIVAIDLPGYGESAAQLPHSFAHTNEVLRRAVDAAGFAAPVMVGHSGFGGQAVMYAAEHPTSGVVDVDAIPNELENMARGFHQMRSMIESDGIHEVWSGILANVFRLDELDPSTREFVLATTELRPDTLRSYWADMLSGDPAELPGLVRSVAAGLATAGVPVLMIAGHEIGAGLDELLGAAMAQTTIEVWPGCGHFPHLAHARRFADRLAATASWRPGHSV